ncbi:MAG: DAK2 domain-containing protein [Clostridia bacterium]|nr:DAK2 domain-containing protein [Clostridia bacterium]
MALKTIDGGMLKEMYLSGCALLNQNREAVDALNVFPVPDGDTGTNMSHTMNAAAKELNARPFSSVSDVASSVARGALKGARGNSGVILSQIFRGIASGLEGAEEMDAELFVRAIRSGAQTAYKAVMKPKEGTILTVARVIAEELEAFYSQGHDDLIELFQHLVKSGEAILKKTPDMLPVLKQAGVVDSGGKGLMVIYAGFYSALTGTPVETTGEAAPVMLPGDYVDDHEALEDITFGYCTEFIVSHPRPDLKNADVTRLRKRLERIGDCVLVISDMSVVKVHVHTNDPGKALQMALELGELDAIKIDNMMEEHRERVKLKEEKLAAEKAKMKEYGIVAVALGDGFSEIFNSLNVDKIVDGGQTMNPSIEEMQKAIDSTNAKNVFVLPNNTNIILAAQQASALTDKNVLVLPTKSVPMGIAAAIAFNEDASVEENLEEMNQAAERVHTASITYAVRDTIFDGREIHENDIMGMVDNRIQVLGDDVHEVARQVVGGMVDDESGLITVYYGSDVSEEQAQALTAEFEEAYPDCDVEMQRGGQPLYYYLISVE